MVKRSVNGEAVDKVELEIISGGERLGRYDIVSNAADATHFWTFGTDLWTPPPLPRCELTTVVSPCRVVIAHH
jgi:hypothetical protein